MSERLRGGQGRDSSGLRGWCAADAVAARTVLIVIPCLNEAAFIGGLLRQLLPFAESVGGRIVVADGGSTDGTVDIVRRFAAGHSAVICLHNPRRIQSAGVNLAVRKYGAGTVYVIRIDAHCTYPDDYCLRLIEEAEATGAGSVVVGMIAEGRGLIQGVNAAVQNSRIGNGGSRHRRMPSGSFVEHGHHALMRTDVFNFVGGYDESFRCNEDAELDYRISQSGERIWLTARTVVTYHPRRTLMALFRQYFTYGRGRAQTVLKHKSRPVARQILVLLVLPALLLSTFAFVTWWAAVPAAIWAAACLASGFAIAVRSRRPRLALAGLSAMIIHGAWSLGFWREVLAPGGTRSGSAS
ncbi:MAG: glycosyltransferase family 2 protein [Paracoccaceae bacterium]